MIKVPLAKGMHTNIITYMVEGWDGEPAKKTEWPLDEPDDFYNKK